MTGLRIGLLVDQPLKRQYLGMSVAEAGHKLICSTTLGADAGEALARSDVDAWVVDVAAPTDEDSDFPAEQLETLEALLESATVPLIVSDSSDYRPGTDEHNAWLRRIMDKLRQLAGDINLQNTERASDLWVLAASTGGPAAVKRFLSELPPDLGVAFLYVQHIDAHYTSTLVKMMSDSPYPASLAVQGEVLQENRLFIVTAQERVEVLENGTFALSDGPWGGPYAPSVDQLVANVARVYGPRAGLIVFSGMGDDGASAGRLLKQRGGRIWVQSPDSCTSSSMPDMALATGCVSYNGTPEQLAQQLTVQYQIPLPMMKA
ncbi:chemotaxis protein CheB [Marinimicrobium sp. ABcell2]|uniref:chemotaxis protein CheB n=1 Tax=Marinimicrobium sp. ABcell2 TaxID=3069751 RepID=UPI0027AF68BF|nr:chemotaxis protein CheB [Marinimicrobium sp. ABcell2]MDQ2076571.1 chemotaxis protein CheB [Marinimicrobium sp. ABcell2]